MISFYKSIIYFLKFYNSRESRQYHLPVFLGFLYKLNSIALFIIPISAIKSVSEGKLSFNIRKILESLSLPIPADKYIFQFFFILILFGLITLIVINKLKNNCILNIKYKNHLTSFKQNKSILDKKLNNNAKSNKEIDNFIKNSENILFCLILSIFIFIYDLQIALILLFGGLLYLFVIKTKSIDKNKKKILSHSIISKKIISAYKNSILFTSYEDNKELIKPIISTAVMVTIMIAIYRREDPSISIIFIFLIRIFQNNMLNSIKDFIKNYNKD